MKSIAKIICCGVALAWMCSAMAEDDTAGQAATTEGQVTETTAAAAGGTGSAAPAGGGAAPAAVAGEDAKAVPTPPAPRIAVKPYHDKINRANVEKRIENNAAITKKRSAVVEKDAADRAAKAQQGQ